MSSAWQAAVGRRVGGVVDRVDGIGRRSLENPVSFAQVTLTFVLLAAAVLVLVAWSANTSDQDLRVPLLVLGLAVIGLGMTISKGAAAITLAVLIVGILVAPREYLLRIAHMISHSAAPFEQYAKTYDSEIVQGPNTTDQVADRVIGLLKQRGVKVEPEVAKAIDRVVTGEELDRIARKIRAEGADYPLRKIVAGGRDWDSFRREFADNDMFLADMRVLQGEGLVVTTRPDFADAAVTELGRNVLTNALEGRALSSMALGSSKAFDNVPSPATMPIIAVSRPIRRALAVATTADWLKFTVPSAGRYVIEVSSAGDPTIRLLGPNAMVVAHENDDRPGDSTDSLIDATLQPGEYYLGIASLFGDPMQYEVKLRRG
jgi:hypothetical protein